MSSTRRSSARLAERVLLDWVNIRGRQDGVTEKEIDRMTRRYPNVFEGFRDQHESDLTILEVRDLLVAAWSSPDPRSRDWYIYKIRDKFHHGRVVLPKVLGRWKESRTGERQVVTTDADYLEDNAPPPLTPFEEVMFRFQMIAHKVRCCANPECPARYFLTTKKGQRYCSSLCSAPAQKEAKRRWWNERGSKQRSERKK